MSNNEPHIVPIRGKIPPQATELESAVLGAMLVDKKAVESVIDILRPDAFYLEKHQLIFGAIKQIYQSGGKVDLLTVSDQLRKSQALDRVGGEFHLIQMTQQVASGAHSEYHARLIQQKYIQRELIRTGSEMIEEAYSEDADVFDLMDDAYSHLNNVSELSVRPQEAKLSELIAASVEKGQKIYRGEIKPGIQTPISRLNRKAGGWRDEELIILAARPGMGKTALAVEYGIHAAKDGIPTAFFSLEMSKAQLTNRIISAETGIPGDKFTNHGLSDMDVAKIKRAEEVLNKIPFFIDDTASLTIEQLKIKAKRMAQKHGIRFFIVDYLQLMISKKSKPGNREQEVSTISRGLKIMAKETGTPVMALSQLSRAVETRGGSKRPMLSDLRESGAIEQDADVVHFIYRPEYYGITEWDDYDHQDAEGEAEYIIAKNRNGGLIRNRMKFEKTTTKFSDMPEEQEKKHYQDMVPEGVDDDFKDFPF